MQARRALVRFLRELKSAAGREDWTAAAAAAKAMIEAEPDCAEAHFGLALASIYLDDLATALSASLRAREIAPGLGDYDDLLAIVYGLGGDLTNALFHGKAATGGARHARLAEIVPDSLPTLAQVFMRIEEQPFLRRALGAAAAGRWVEAERCFRQHLAFDSECRDAAIGLGGCLLAQDHPLAAIETLRAARHRLPGDGEIASLLARALSQIGAFDQSRACHVAARALAPEDADIAAAALLDAVGDPANANTQLAAGFRNWVKAFAINDGRAAALPRSETGRPLSVGYVFGNAAESPTACWLAEVLSHRQSARFRVVGFGHGPLSAPSNMVFQKCVDRWQNVHGADPLTLAAMVRAERVDILVDLAGFEAPALLAAFGSRMAPCQVSWLGNPCGVAFDAVDFVLSDLVTDAGTLNPDARSPGRPAFLRLGGVLAPPPAAVEPSPPVDRGGSEILFAADANLSELNATTVEWWSAVLHAVPAASLILRDHGFADPKALERLIDVFGTFGVAHRVDVVAEPSPQAFFARGDVCLLPGPCPRPASVSDALSAGLPIVCPVQAGWHTRAAASVLDYLGLGATTLAKTREAYVELAVHWAGDGEARRAFAANLAEVGARSETWDAAARARDLAEALTFMWHETVAAAGATELRAARA